MPSTESKLLRTAQLWQTKSLLLVPGFQKKTRQGLAGNSVFSPWASSVEAELSKTKLLLYLGAGLLTKSDTPHTRPQAKTDLARFMESILAKTTKIRQLTRDLRANYSGDPSALEPGPHQAGITLLKDLKPNRTLTCLSSHFGFRGYDQHRSLSELEKGIKKLDSEYDACSEVLTDGEVDGFGDKL